MPAKRYKVTLTKEERQELSGLVRKDKGEARRLTRPRILLMADENQSEAAWKDADIAKALGVLHRQSLAARIPDQATLIEKVTAWQNRRNARSSTLHWRFSTDDARIKLHRLYPSIDPC